MSEESVRQVKNALLSCVGFDRPTAPNLLVAMVVSAVLGPSATRVTFTNGSYAVANVAGLDFEPGDLCLVLEHEVDVWKRAAVPAYLYAKFVLALSRAGLEETEP